MLNDVSNKFNLPDKFVRKKIKDQSIIVNKFNKIFAVDYSASCLSNVVISGTFELGNLYQFIFK